MTPIVVRAKLSGAVCLPMPVALDALLMAAVAMRDDLPPLGFRECVALEIPIAQERGIYLASEAQYEREVHERRWLSKRFPIAEAQSMGEAKLRRINMSAGQCKQYRIPMETIHLRDDEMTWFAMGNATAVHALLAWITHVGKKRSVGLGRVSRWTVDATEPWEGFPVLRGGRPLRALPLDWPGLGGHRTEHRVLSPPYWERWREQECAVAC